MKKMFLVVVLAVLLIAGAIFASANFLQEDKVRSDGIKVGVPQECNSGTCNQQCGGDCGIPSCGCGK